MATVCGTGIGNGGATPLPSDPVGSMTLTAIAGFGGVNVRWTMPGMNAHALAHTLLFRGTSENFAATVQVAVVSGNSYYDRIDEAGTYYYWIRPVSVNGTLGELYGPASATIRTMSDDIMGQISGRISAGVLATSLRATLDNISMINSRLNEEIFDRETGETSFAQALIDVSNGVAAAHSFITTAINSQVTANSAIAEQIDLVAVTLGDQVAAVIISADAWIGPHATLNGKVSDIGALWTAKLTVNNLIGGFGIYNDGSTVEAGFDVDTFWIGRSAVDKVLPFVISDGVVYINKARIKDADIGTLKLSGNAVTVSVGNSSQTGGVQSGGTSSLYVGLTAAHPGKITVIGTINVPNVGHNQELYVAINGAAGVKVAYESLAGGTTSSFVYTTDVTAGAIGASIVNDDYATRNIGLTILLTYR